MIPETTKKIRGWPISQKIGHRSPSRMSKKTQGNMDNTCFMKTLFFKSIQDPIPSMYGIFTYIAYIWLIFLVLLLNVTNPFLVSAAMEIRK